MKKLIVLPGNSPRNVQWGETCEAHFTSWFDDTYLQRYDHWETGQQWINFDDELAKLRAVVEADGEDVQHYIFAKSIGSILAVIAIDQGKVEPARLVCFGMPLDYAAGRVFDHDWDQLIELTVPTLAFHHDHDPTASYTFTRDTLQKRAPQVRFVTLEGDTHDYDHFSDYEHTIKPFLGFES